MWKRFTGVISAAALAYLWIVVNLFGIRLGCFVVLCSVVTLDASAASGSTPWAQVYSDDLPKYAANLRAEGFPAEVIGLLVSHEFNKRFAGRERKLAPSTLTVEGLRNFWSHERRAESRLLRVEKHLLARAVLGEASGVTAEEDWVSQHLDALPPKRRDLVRAIIEDYDDLIARVKTAAQGFLAADDRDAITYLEQERLGDLGAYLMPEQVADFHLQHSEAGRLVLEDLFCFEPTPQELRDYFTTMVAHGLDDIALELEAPDVTSRRVAARVKTIAELRASWAPERLTRLRVCLAHPYRKIYPFVHRLGLTTADADAVLESFRRLNEAVGAIADRPPSFGSVASLEDVARFHETRRTEVIGHYEAHCADVRRVLGDAAFDEYYKLFEEAFSWHEQGQLMCMPVEFIPYVRNTK